MDLKVSEDITINYIWSAGEERELGRRDSKCIPLERENDERLGQGDERERPGPFGIR